MSAAQVRLWGMRQVVGFNRNTVMGGGEVGPGAKVRADGVEGVMDVGTDGRFLAGVVAGEVVVTINIKRFAKVASAANEFRKGRHSLH